MNYLLSNLKQLVETGELRYIFNGHVLLEAESESSRGTIDDHQSASDAVLGALFIDEGIDEARE